MPSEASRPQAETRTIIIDRQRLRIAIRPGNGTRTPLGPGENSHTATLPGSDSHGTHRRRNLRREGAQATRASARVCANRTPGRHAWLLLSNAGGSGVDQHPLAPQTPAAHTDPAWG